MEETRPSRELISKARTRGLRVNEKNKRKERKEGKKKKQKKKNCSFNSWNESIESIISPITRKEKRKDKCYSHYRINQLIRYSKGRISSSGLLGSRFAIAICQARAVVEKVNRGGTSVEKKDTQRSGYLVSLLNSLLYFPPRAEGRRVFYRTRWLSLTVHPYLFRASFSRWTRYARDSTRDRTSARSVIPATCAL